MDFLCVRGSGGHKTFGGGGTVTRCQMIRQCTNWELAIIGRDGDIDHLVVRIVVFCNDFGGAHAEGTHVVPYCVNSTSSISMLPAPAVGNLNCTNFTLVRSTPLSL